MSFRLGLAARPMTLICKKITVEISKEVETGCNVAESSKEVCGSKRVVFLLLLMMNEI
jgi:hypothetical protein